MSELDLGHHPFVFAVEKFLGLVFLRAGSQNDNTMFDFASIHPGADQKFSGEIALEA